jgi:hypothetical protein
VLAHIKRLDDCFGQFLVRVICDCGAVRELEPQALARLVGWRITLKDLAVWMRCSKCGKKAAEVVAVARRGREECRRILNDVASLGAADLINGGKLPYGVTLQVKAKRLPTIPFGRVFDLTGLDCLSAQTTGSARSGSCPKRLGHSAGQTSAGDVLAGLHKEI